MLSAVILLVHQQEQFVHSIGPCSVFLIVIVQGLASFFPRFFAVLYNSGQENTWDLGTNGWDSMRGNTLNQSYSYMNQAKNAWGLTPAAGELALAVNTCPDLEEAKKLADEAVNTALAQHYIYPLTYTNYVMVAQKYVDGLDCSAIVPEFIDWLGISVNG